MERDQGDLDQDPASWQGPQVPNPRLHALTSLRFFAALWVALNHVFGPTGTPVLELSYLGVTFFFVLSGFVLAWSGSTRDGTAAFYRNRVARIVPLHLATLLVAASLPYATQDGPGTLAQNLTLTQAWTPAGAHSFNWVSWSISCEAFFYLLFPAALFLLRRCSSRYLLVAGFAAVGSQAEFGAIFFRAGSPPANFLTYDFPLYRLGEFLLGICLAEFLRRGPLLPRWAVRSGAAVAVISAALAVGPDLVSAPRADRASLLALPAIVALIHACVRREASGSDWWLTARPLRKLGEWSFALYMVHMLVVRPVAAWLGLPHPGLMPLGPGLAVVAVSVLLGGVVCETVEKPLERRLRAGRRSHGGRDVRATSAPVGASSIA
jgi:peptidoglycan/LPS O-acetylase OafA/YrhL